MKILVVGASGQIARALARHEGVVALGRPTLDLERPETFQPALARCTPDVVIVAGAWTAVEEAEDAPQAAWRINAEGPGALAQICAAPLLYVSTDYVFDGAKASPYVETDVANPVGAYGRSKAEGERRVLGAGARNAVVRTAWVHDAAGRNFVRTMLRLAKARPRIDVVDDQWGNPSYAPHVAAGLIALARALANGGDGGVWHLAGRGACSWATFAQAIFDGAAARGGPVAEVNRIPASQYPARVARPANSRLDCSRIAARLGVVLPDWEAGLAECLDRIAAVGWDVA